ncbi:unnamed protein product [Symbiodinium sp. CCMP2456]|nr:unnamed protein product [Symbiodinium sp. CCMP2456]
MASLGWVYPSHGASGSNLAHRPSSLGSRQAARPPSGGEHGSGTALAAALACAAARAQRRPRGTCRATTVEAESTTGLAPWEIEEETEDERQARYAREADEMKLKWDARRLEEKHSAQRRQAWSQKEQERASLYGPRDPIMEAYEARMYEEARVIEIRRRQREVYERIKAHKEGKPLPPKGTPYLVLKPAPMEPPKPEEFDVSGHYKPEEDIEARKYKAPDSYAGWPSVLCFRWANLFRGLGVVGFRLWGGLGLVCGFAQLHSHSKKKRCRPPARPHRPGTSAETRGLRGTQMGFRNIVEGLWNCAYG